MGRAVIGALRVSLGLDSAQFETGIRRAKGTLNTFNRDMSGISATAAKLSGVFNALGIATGSITLAGAAVATARYTDTANKLTAQLRLATAQSGSFAQAQEDVRRIAADTRSGLEETAKLYGNFQRNSRELGISQEEAARATETVSKAFKISGASAEESGQGTRQLVQALQSGVLRGDEFNTMAEAAPRLQKLLADSLGVTQGKLREMAEAGELTSDKLTRAFTDKKYTAGLDAEFKELPVTFDAAMTQISNAAIITFGAFDRGGDFSTILTNFATGGASDFADLESAAESFGIKVRSEFAGMAALADNVTASVRNLVAALGQVTMDGAFNPAAFGPLGMIGRTVGLAGTGMGSKAVNGAGRFLNPLGAAVDLARASKPYREAVAETSARQRARIGERSLKDSLGGYDVMGNRTSAPERLGASGKKKTGGSKGPSAETLRKRAEQEAERAADALRRFTDDLARQQTDLSEAMARLSGSTDAMANAQVQKIEDDRAIAEREIMDRERISDAQRQELINLNNQNTNAQKALVRKEQMERDRENADRIATDQLGLEAELLQLSSNLARTASERRDIELRIVDLAFKEEKIRLEGIKAVSAATSAEWAYADARLKKLDDLKAGSISQARQQTQGPLESYLDGIPKTADEAREALERVKVDGLEGLTDGLADAITGARSLGDVFKGIANQIIGDLARIAIQQAITAPLANALFGGGGGATGGGGGLFGSIFGGLQGFATGGSFKVGGSSTVGDKQMVAFRANAGEMVDVRKPGNDNGRGQPIVMHNDFRGADPMAVTAINARLDAFQERMPSIILTTVSDGRARRMIP